MPPLPRHQTLYPRFFKRLLDIAGALVLLSLLAPFLLLLALIIAVNSRGCPIFTQWRIGRGCVPFRIIKFKTIINQISTVSSVSFIIYVLFYILIL